MKQIPSIFITLTALLFLHTSVSASSQATADIDSSSANDGYVRVAYFGNGDERINVLITRTSGTQYRYDLNSGGEYETFPLSEGNGDYTIAVCRSRTCRRISGREPNYRVR
ncbi:MAG: hypothetical protein LBC65_01610 [Oscillospiraceae bacterium]|jgi:hypothetical protein|nr:hypothetical protein [Oscillospiraceae bacterium]